jgi:hypothetical protein
MQFAQHIATTHAQLKPGTYQTDDGMGKYTFSTQNNLQHSTVGTSSPPFSSVGIGKSSIKRRQDANTLSEEGTLTKKSFPSRDDEQNGGELVPTVECCELFRMEKVYFPNCFPTPRQSTQTCSTYGSLVIKVCFCTVVRAGY